MVSIFSPFTCTYNKVEKPSLNGDRLRDLPAGKLQRNGCELRNPFHQSIESTIRSQTTCNCGIFDVDRSIFSTKLADFMLNTITSLVRNVFSKQISFHAKFTFQRPIEEPDSGLSLSSAVDAESGFAT